jgi:hypothetical protein
VRFKRADDADRRLREWLLQQTLPALPGRPGLGSAHRLQGALTPAMTREQQIRGADAGVDGALLVTGYDRAALETLLNGELGAAALAQHGAIDATEALYSMHYTLTRQQTD